MFIHPDAGSDLDGDTDIDPMRAGLNQWVSDDQEEEDEDDEEEEDNEWEEDDADGNVAESSSGVHPQSSLSRSESNGPVTRRRQLHSPEYEGATRFRIRERRLTYNATDVLANLEEELEALTLVENSGDFIDARGFDELLERLAEADNSRRGAPPAAVSFVNSLPRVVINEEQDGLACAICKDFLFIGSVVNQLPCFHLYHPSCILPWLQARNSCPLCRYELPTDDKDYEEGKQNISSSNLDINEIQQQGIGEDSSSDMNDDAEADSACEYNSHDGMEQVDCVREEHARGRGSARGRWFILAATAPIVSLVGVVLVLWLGNPLTERRGPIVSHNLPRRRQHPNHGYQRENGSRRWWSPF
ncbi:RING-type E3 ubiquitin transferase [Sarracenia purpurea var. burkii]